MPETLWGYDHIASAYSVDPAKSKVLIYAQVHDHIASAYSVDPAKSKVLIYAQVRKNFPEAAPETLDAVLGWTQ